MECYLCQSKKVQPFFEKLSHEFVKCLSCGFVFLKPKPGLFKTLALYYENGFFTGDKNYCGFSNYLLDKKVTARNMRRNLDKILSFNKEGKLLDMGCATGIFLKIAQKKGFEPFGVDSSSFAFTHIPKNLKAKVQKTTIGKAEFPDKFFNLVTMWDLIEHLFDPRSDLKHIKKFLKENGVLVIGTSDVESPWAKLWGKNWHFFAPPQHLYYFSKRTLRKLLNQAGFKIIHTTKWGKWVSLRYILHLMRSINQNRLANFFYPLVASNPLGRIPLYLNLGDSLIVFAGKKQ